MIELIVINGNSEFREIGINQCKNNKKAIATYNYCIVDYGKSVPRDVTGK